MKNMKSIWWRRFIIRISIFQKIAAYVRLSIMYLCSKKLVPEIACYVDEDTAMAGLVSIDYGIAISAAHHRALLLQRPYPED